MRKVGVADQAQLLEQLEGAIDRGDVHSGGALTHTVMDLLRGGMAEVVDRLQDQLALRSQTQAALPEHLGKGCGGHVTSIVRAAIPSAL
ncbi:hypothetical protein GCM10010435_20730 [Winogradskya consettensis]|uniref:Uncharacterized protein n=1 Tax=Winogradskya consettensis TaxID=113560 RepID=A0A919SV99_9ACTN|nr:hypothetical protein Aco04nite_58320 [Actinoplanes consettensis]